MKKTLWAIALSAVLAGCAGISVGTPFKWDQARQIREGMTEVEVTRLMGAPYMVRSQLDGQVWIWSLGSAFGDSRSVSLMMKDGRVVKAPMIPESFR